MSRAAVRAKQRARRLTAREVAELERRAAVDAAYARADQHAALDAVLARCDGCGLELVAPGGLRLYSTEWDVRGCPVCGGTTGRFVERLPGHHAA